MRDLISKDPQTPHLINSNLIKAFKVLKTSGSLAKGFLPKKPKLTQNFCISYPDKKQL